MSSTPAERNRSRAFRNVVAAILFAATIGGVLYLRYIDWPPNDGGEELADLAGEDPPARSVY